MAALAAAPPSWDLLFLLPHVNIPRPSPFDGGVVRLVAGNDPILEALRATPPNETGHRMLAAFGGQFGRAYVPGCLIVDSNAPRQTTAALRAFRNACAIATVLPAYADGQLAPRFSDFFDIYPLVPHDDGSIVAVDAIMPGGYDDPDHFAGQCSALIQTPWNFTCHPSQRLLTQLLRAWRTCFQTRRRRQALLRLFRTVDVAVHACRFPTDNLRSVYDVGLRLVVWVSAFEVLLHPTGGQINLPSVLGVIGGLPWTNRELTRSRYRRNYRGHRLTLTLPEAVYFDLYTARNDFAHGNQVRRRRLTLRRRPRGGPLLQLAPLLFRVVLEHQLDIWLPRRLGPQPPPNASYRWLLTAAGRRYLRARVAEWGERPNTEAALIETARPR